MMSVANTDLTDGRIYDLQIPYSERSFIHSGEEATNEIKGRSVKKKEIYKCNGAKQ